jgi:hypothetical protein
MMPVTPVVLRQIAAIAAVVWPQEVMDYLRSQFERLIMQELVDISFRVTHADTAADADTALVLRSLQWLPPSALHVPPAISKPLVLSAAVQELRSINAFAAPEDKLERIVAACGIFSKALSQHARRVEGAHGAAFRGEEDAVGADELLPAVIYLALQANPAHLASNLAYIERFRDPQAMFSRAGYCFVHFRSAVNYLLSLDPRTAQSQPAAPPSHALRPIVSVVGAALATSGPGSTGPGHRSEDLDAFYQQCEQVDIKSSSAASLHDPSADSAVRTGLECFLRRCRESADGAIPSWLDAHLYT